MWRGLTGRARRLVALLERAALVAAAAGLLPAAVAAAEPPRRIVSLNLCTDQLLLDLVPRERIAGLSHLVTDRALSGRADAAHGLPLLRGHAEEVLALRPDLVIAGSHSTPATVDLLRRLGVPVVLVPMASDFAGIRAAVRIVAAAAGVAETGEAAVAAFDRRLAAATHVRADTAGRAPGAVVYHVNSLASGAGSLLDEIVRAAGYRNAARHMRLGPLGRLPLETLVLEAPEVVVVATEPQTYRTTAADNLRHPALHALLRTRRTVELPMPLWMCGTPDVVDAVERLVAARPPSTRGPTSP